METRRRFIIGAVGALAAGCLPSRAHTPSAESPVQRAAFAPLEQRIGGRLGVFALDAQSGREISHRADERFALCSTFKWVLAAQVLACADRSQLSLSESIPYGENDLLEYAPVTREHVAGGSMTVDELARAAVTVSDNTAANLLLAKLGGPLGLTRFVRSLDDSTTRLDRIEPMLNTNDLGDRRDTTTPRAMVVLMNRVLCGNVLSPDGRQHLLDWLYTCETGKHRLRAGLPPDWKVGDKTGTGNNGACNDVAFAMPPGRRAVLIAAYLSESRAGLAELEAAHAEIGRIVSAAFAQP